MIVIEGNPDRILGRVRTRVLLAEPGRALRDALEPCRFVPEVATALHALHFLRETKVAQAVAIDEWGGTAGIVTVESIFEEVVGDLRVEGETAVKPVVALGGGRFEVDGSISIRDWNEQFGSRVVPREFETLGGFVAALLRRIPRTGDTVATALTTSRCWLSRIAPARMPVPSVRCRPMIAGSASAMPVEMPLMLSDWAAVPGSKFWFRRKVGS